LCKATAMRHTLRMVATHGHFLAAEVGELAGVSGTTIGQWARWGYIRSSGSDGEPRVYSVEDVAEAAIVGELLERGVSHADVRRAIARLSEEYGGWPLSEAPLGTTTLRGRTRVVLRERDGLYALCPRGWQLMAAPPAIDEVRLRLNRGHPSGDRPG
jgi:DNA-binding transcriptional MerR regulator